MFMKRRTMAAALLVICAGPPSPTIAQQPAEFPAAFRGEWNADVEAPGSCRVGDMAATQGEHAFSRVTARRIEGYTGACELKSIKQHPEIEGLISATLLCEDDESDPWTETTIMQLTTIRGRTYRLSYTTDESGYVVAAEKCRTAAYGGQ